MSKLTIGIRKEDERKRLERRTPLTPEAVRRLLSAHPDLDIWVEQSNGLGYKYQRVYRDEEYAAAGASIVPTLEGCPVVFGIKEIEYFKLYPDTVYICFSHTFKGQAHNMPLLKRWQRLGCTLVDYEMLVHDVPDDLYHQSHTIKTAPAAFQRRTVYFGKFAGISGIVDALWALGQRWSVQGYAHNPLRDLKKAMAYQQDGEPFGTFALAEIAIRDAAERIARDGLGGQYPLIIGVAGQGHSAQGTMEVLDLLPIEKITPNQLLEGFHPTPEEMKHTVYVVTFGREHTKEGLAPYLPYLTMLMNCITWKGDAPRLVTRDNVKGLYGTRGAARGANGAGVRLQVIGDVSCDPGGAIEFSEQTFPDDPVYTYDPSRDDGSLSWEVPDERAEVFARSCRHGVEGNGPVVMAVTNLPCEFPKDASDAFSDMLEPYVLDIARLQLDQPWDAVAVSRPVKRATMLYQGTLTPDYTYLENHLSKEVLVLGAGQVSPALLAHLKSKQYKITITDMNPAAAQARVDALGTGHVIPLEIRADTPPEALFAAFKKADCVISILPPPLHPVAARAAVYARVPLVTASYVSPEMAALADEATAAGVTLLNEMGLDPGIDHMSAVVLLRRIEAEGGTVESFSSYCGGLPAPDAALNPLRYKFSWSPAGVVNATTNAATFLAASDVVTVAAADLFAAPTPLPVEGWNDPFETYPNRNSLPYIDRYDVPDTHDFIRGTIRYAGWGQFFNVLRGMGWLATTGTPAATFDETGVPDAVVAALHWLLDGQTIQANETPIHALTRFLMAKPELQYAAGEQDMVVMQHKVVARYPDGQRKTHTATLTLYGEPAKTSAMSLTTGGTIAIGAEAILEGVVTQPGVLIPIDPTLAHFALERLEAWGVLFEEGTEPVTG